MVLELEDKTGALVCTAHGDNYTSFTAQFAAKVMWGAFSVHGVDERNSVEHPHKDCSNQWLAPAFHQ